MTRKELIARIAAVQAAGATELYPAFVREHKTGYRAGQFAIAAPRSFFGGRIDWQKIVTDALGVTRCSSNLSADGSVYVTYVRFDNLPWDARAAARLAR